MKTTLHHGFDPYLAEEYGLEEAILIHHFQYWIQINHDANRNERDGRFWTYQTLEDIALRFPYFNRDKVKRIIKSLFDKGVIIKGNYNKTSFDRTVWYAFKNQENFIIGQKRHMDGAQSPDQCGESDTPIPDTLQDTKKQQQAAAVFPCLKELKGISNEHKERITRTYLEPHVEHAVTCFKSKPSETIENPSGLLESFCKQSRDSDCEEPKRLETQEEVIEKNIEYKNKLEKYNDDTIGIYTFHVNRENVEFVTTGQDARANKIFHVESKRFIEDVYEFFNSIRK